MVDVNCEWAASCFHYKGSPSDQCSSHFWSIQGSELCVLKFLKAYLVLNFFSVVKGNTLMDKERPSE